MLPDPRITKTLEVLVTLTSTLKDKTVVLDQRIVCVLMVEAGSIALPSKKPMLRLSTTFGNSIYSSISSNTGGGVEPDCIKIPVRGC